MDVFCGAEWMMMSCVLFPCCPATQPTNTRRHAIPKKMSPRHRVLRVEKQQCRQAVLCFLQARIPAAVLCSVMFSRPETHLFPPQMQTIMRHVVILVFGSIMHFNIFLPFGIRDIRCVLIHCKVHSQCIRSVYAVYAEHWSRVGFHSIHDAKFMFIVPPLFYFHRRQKFFSNECSLNENHHFVFSAHTVHNSTQWMFKWEKEQDHTQDLISSSKSEEWLLWANIQSLP